MGTFFSPRLHLVRILCLSVSFRCWRHSRTIAIRRFCVVLTNRVLKYIFSYVYKRLLSSFVSQLFPGKGLSESRSHSNIRSVLHKHWVGKGMKQICKRKHRSGNEWGTIHRTKSGVCRTWVSSFHVVSFLRVSSALSQKIYMEVSSNSQETDVFFSMQISIITFPSFDSHG